MQSDVIVVGTPYSTCQIFWQIIGRLLSTMLLSVFLLSFLLPSKLTPKSPRQRRNNLSNLTSNCDHCSSPLHIRFPLHIHNIYLRSSVFSALDRTNISQANCSIPRQCQLHCKQSTTKQTSGRAKKSLQPRSYSKSHAPKIIDAAKISSKAPSTSKHCTRTMSPPTVTGLYEQFTARIVITTISSFGRKTSGFPSCRNLDSS